MNSHTMRLVNWYTRRGCGVRGRTGSLFGTPGGVVVYGRGPGGQLVHQEGLWCTGEGREVVWYTRRVCGVQEVEGGSGIFGRL